MMSMTATLRKTIAVDNGGGEADNKSCGDVDDDDVDEFGDR